MNPLEKLQNQTEVLTSVTKELKQDQLITNKQIEETRALLEKVSDQLGEGVRTTLSDEDRKTLENAEIIFKHFKRLYRSPIILSAVSGVILALLLYFTLKFYNSSIETRQEVRNVILQEFRNKNQTLVDKTKLQALENERELLKIWKKDNPNDSKSLDVFRSGLINGNPNFDFFEGIDDDDIREANPEKSE